MFLDQDLLPLLLTTGKKLRTGELFLVQGNSSVTHDPVTSWVSHSPAPQEWGARADQEQSGQHGAMDSCCCASRTHVCCTAAAELVPGLTSCHLKSNKWFAVEQMGWRIDPLIYLHVCVYKDKIHTKIKLKKETQERLKIPRLFHVHSGRKNKLSQLV